MNKAKILIVEDERIIAEDLSQMLRRLGYEVTGIVASGREALKSAAADPPDLAIMDIILRGKMDGIETAQLLKERFGVSAIYLTAYADEKILKRARITSPYGYIIKPFDEKELHTNIEIALERNRTDRLVGRTNLILMAVRDINQLIVREHNRRKLIQTTCKILTHKKSYPRAWIILFDDEGHPTLGGQAGWGRKFNLLVEQVEAGIIPECGLKALDQRNVFIRQGDAPLCQGCPFKDVYPRYGNLTMALRSHGKTYGLLSVVLPDRILVEQTELSLFDELVGDIAFGLHDLELAETRKRLERELGESEARFRRLASTTATAIFVYSGNKFIYVNRATCRLTGYKKEELQAMNFWDVVHPDFKTMIRERGLARQRGEKVPNRYEFKIIRKNGTERWIDFTTGKINWKGRAAAIGSAVDITERKQAEEQLKASESKFRGLFEGINDAVFVHPLKEEGFEHFIEVNEVACRRLGYSRKELLKLSPADISDPEGVENRGSREGRARLLKDNWMIFEATHITKSGKRIPVEISWHVFKLDGRDVTVSVARDISERKQLEKTLQHIVEGTSTAVGKDFFNHLILSTAESLGMEIVFITRRDLINPQLVRTLAWCSHGQIEDNIEWEVADTPCERVIKGETVIVPDDVQKKFPKDLMLQEVRAKSYLAVPIYDTEGKVIGHLGVLDSRPMDHPEYINYVISIFALRAGTELQRLQAEEELESIFSANPLPVLILDEDRIIQRSNAAAREYCQTKAEELTGLRPGEALLCIHHLDDPKGCGFGPDCKNCVTRNTILETLQDHQTRQGVESKLTLRTNGRTHTRMISLNTAYFETLYGPRVMVVFEDITEEKQSQVEVFRLKKFNENIVTGVAEGIVVMDAKGVMEYVNPAAEAMLGYGKSEMEGQHWSLVIPEDQHSIVNAVDERRMKGESSVYDLQLIRKGGQRIDVRVSGSPRFENGEFIGTMAVFTDVTEQKQTLEALKASESFNKTVLTSVSQGVIVFDREFRYKVWNSFMEALTGYKAEKVLGKVAFEVFPFLKEQGLDRLIRRALKGETVTSPEFHFQFSETKNEGWAVSTYTPHLDVQGKIIGVVGLVRDITESREAVEKLRESEARYRSILESIEEGYYEVDIKGNFTFFNDSLCRMLGYSREELLGMNNRDYMDAESAERVYQVFNQVYQTGDPSGSVELKIREKSGEIKYGEVSVTLLKDKDQVIGFRGIVRDVTQRMEAEEERRRSEENLRNLFRFTTDAIIIQNKDREIIDCNRAAEELFGYSREELLSDQTIQLGDLSKVDQNKRRETMELAFQGQPQRFEWWGKKKDGTSFPEEILLNKTVYNGEEVLFITIRDITERKRQEGELVRSEEKYRTMVEMAPDVIITIDRAGYITNINSAVKKIAGWDGDEILNKHFTNIPWIRARDLPKYVKYFNQMVRGKIPETFEVEWFHSDGTIHTAEIHITAIRDQGKITGFQAISLDITERKKARQILEQQTHLQKALSDLSRQAILEPDLDQFLEYVVRKVAETLEVKFSKVLELQPGGEQLLLRAGTGWKKGYVGHALVDVGENSQAGYTLKTREPVVVDDLKMEKRFSGPSLLTDHKIVSGVSALIGDPEHPWGVLGAHSDEHRTFSPAKINFMLSVAGIIDGMIKRWQVEEKFKYLVENAPTGILSIDDQGRITQVNQKLLEILGSPSAEETMKINILEFEPLKKAGASAGFQKVLETGETVHLEHEYTSKWGKTVFLRYQVVPIRDAHNQIIGAQANIEDMTEEKKVQQEVFTLANALKSIRECVSITDQSDKILFVNDAFLETYGYTWEEVLGQKISMVHSPNNPPDLTAGILPATLEGGWQGELLNIRKDGSEFPVALSTSLIRGEQGEIIGLIGVAEDITERKQAEEEIKRRAEELSRFNQLMVGRELKMVNLKREVNELLEKLGLPKKYEAPDKLEE